MTVVALSCARKLQKMEWNTKYMSRKIGSLEKAIQAKGWLTKTERVYLFSAASIVPDSGAIVNIGVEYGASVVCMAEGNSETSIWAIDIDTSKWVGGIYENVKIEKGNSHDIVLELFQSVPHIFIDLLFIDGDHSYDGVKKDLPWLSFVRFGGTVIFHDCYEWPPEPPQTPRSVSPEVNRAVSDWWLTEQSRGRWYEAESVDSMRVFKRI